MCDTSLRLQDALTDLTGHTHLLWIQSCRSLIGCSLTIQDTIHMCCLIAGGALFAHFSDVSFNGAARFTSNQAVPANNKPAEGGAIRSTQSSTILFKSASTFTRNKASIGGAIKLDGTTTCKEAYSDKLTFANGSSSCWVGNSASQASGGAGLHIAGSSIADFGLIRQHNFGFNRAGPVEQQWESSIWADQGMFTCGGGRGRSGGRYAITGSVCAASCTGRACTCATSQVFSASSCSCQKRRTP
jgi:hypothetical protein